MGIERFYEPQKEFFETACNEIKKGGKDTHWMWFIFPQMKGLGTSGVSQYYGIISLDEAVEFLNDPVLGVHLLSISEALLKRKEKASEIFGYPDVLKLKSSMTLFLLAAKKAGKKEEEEIFRKVLDQFYDGEICERTLLILDGKYTIGWCVEHPNKS